MRTLEKFNYRNSLNVEYLLYHDSVYLEIDANLYAVIKTKEFLKKKYPDIFKENEEKLEKWKKRLC